jgi:hypothetical protein
MLKYILLHCYILAKLDIKKQMLIFNVKYYYFFTTWGKEKMEEIKIKERLELESRLNLGAGWFYWIAVLSLLNSFIMLSGSDWYFVIGLGITQIIDAVIGSRTAFLFDMIVASLLIMFGYMAKNRNNWSFAVGMVLYGLDGILVLALSDYLSFGFHIFVLLGIYGGLKASIKLGEYEHLFDNSL